MKGREGEINLAPTAPNAPTVLVASADKPSVEQPLALPSRSLRLSLFGVRIRPGWALTGIVLISTLVRSVTALARLTPTYFPDEYYYSSISRSIMEHGSPRLRGEAAHIPSLLEPLLTAPAWLIGNTEVAVAVALVFSAAVMSLTAVPAYLLSVRLGLGRTASLGIAVFTVCLPGMMYASSFLGEPFAYPLALAAVLAGTVSLGRGGRRWMVAFVGLSAAASMARAQLLVIPLAYIVAALIVAFRSRAPRAFARQQALLLTVLVAPLAALLLRPSTLGIYGQTLHSGGDGMGTGGTFSSVVRSLGGNLLMLVYGSGVVLVPGALLGLAAAILKPRSRMELAVGAFGGCFTGALILQSSMWGQTDRPQERYFMYCFPLVAVMFAMGVERGWPWLRANRLIVVGLAALAALVPVSGYTEASMKSHSATLRGFADFLTHVGTGNGALVIALAATGLALASLGLPRLSARHALTVGLGLACAACIPVAFGATKLDLLYSKLATHATFPGSRTWIDDAHVGNSVFLWNGGSRGDAFTQLFWNRSLERVYLMPGSPRFDIAQPRRVEIAGDGTVLAKGKPIRAAVLTDTWAAVVRLRNASHVAKTGLDDLYAVRGPVQLALYANGIYRNGVSQPTSDIRLWPERTGGVVHGRLTFKVGAPKAFPRPVKLTVTPSHGAPYDVRLTPGSSRSLTFDVCSRGTWKVRLHTNGQYWYAGAVIGFEASQPNWRPDASACTPS